MTSVSAFNDMMESFIGELQMTFPEEKAIKKYSVSFDILRKSNPRKCVEKFVTAVAPYATFISEKNEAFIFQENTGFLTDINIKNYWTADLSQNTKDAIWQYLQTLYMLGTTIVSIPAETLSAIERIAEQCAGQMQMAGENGGVGQIDEKALMSTMSGLLGGMFANNK
jgi:hypothetical protein